jgi:hypothetical protein
MLVFDSAVAAADQLGAVCSDFIQSIYAQLVYLIQSKFSFIERENLFLIAPTDKRVSIKRTMRLVQLLRYVQTREVKVTE